MHLDINLRPPNVDDLGLMDIKDNRAEVLWGHIIEKIVTETGLDALPAKKIALYAMAGMVQNFEGSSINRIKNYAREIFSLRALINPDDILEVSQANALPRTFTTQIIDGTLQVIGTNLVALTVFPSEPKDPYTLGTIMTIRRYSISLDGAYRAQRQPDTYFLGEA
jgi:hypothetical protein